MMSTVLEAIPAGGAIHEPPAPRAPGGSARTGDHELQAATPAGARLVALAETLAAELAETAGEHDAQGGYPLERLETVRRAGYLAAPIPVEHGGLGVETVHDLAVASSRLARGDASLAIGVNMHLAVVANMARRWRIARHTGQGGRADALGRTMEGVSHGGAVLATAVSEPAQDLTHPATRATRIDGGWRIDGRKIFCTMSPGATVLVTAVSFEDADGEERYGYVQVPRNAPNVVVHDDWDALGMRTSGSNSVSFHGVELPESALRGGFPAGRLTVDFLERNLNAGALHASSSVGIAEHAHASALAGLARRRGAPGAHAQMLVAGNAIELSAMRAMLDRAGHLIDGHFADHPDTDGSLEETAALFAEVQATKTFANEAAVRVVDRALALSGGAGYMTRHPLSRAYRDVRAGAFMHPLGANRAYELIAQVAMGMEPTLS
jgi:alkylation response protein AidB-like acyl-CoA dehydrogenase